MVLLKVTFVYEAITWRPQMLTLGYRLNIKYIMDVNIICKIFIWSNNLVTY